MSKCVNIVFSLTGMLFVGLFIISCKPSVPHEYIQPDEMENILHDYYVARAMSDMTSQPSSMVTYKTAVFKKYGVTEAEFNASLAYYARHADRLHDIYESLSERLDQESIALGGNTDDNSFDTFSANGDTANIWRDGRALMLLPYKPQNFFTFHMAADTSFHKGDSFLLRFHADYMAQNGSREGVAMMKVRFSNDSIALKNVRIYGSSRYTVQLDDTEKAGVQDISGYFLLNNTLSSSEPSTNVQVMILSGIELIRMHNKTDSLSSSPANGPAVGSRIDTVSHDTHPSVVGKTPPSPPSPRVIKETPVRRVEGKLPVKLEDKKLK